MIQAASRDAFDKLVSSLDELIKVYRALLQVVRKEKEILASANLDDLNENNKTKEKLLMQARTHEAKRGQCAMKLAQLEGLATDDLKLDDFAIHFENESGEKLRNLQSVLKILLGRVKKINSENEILVKSALSNITGAMNSIKESLVENKTYKNKGDVASTGTQAGYIVNRQV